MEGCPASAKLAMKASNEVTLIIRMPRVAPRLRIEAVLIRAPDKMIARRADTQARADFATWKMMAKLNGASTLTAEAQRFLVRYRTFLTEMTEAEVLAGRSTHSPWNLVQALPSRLTDRIDCSPGARKRTRIVLGGFRWGGLTCAVICFSLAV